MIPTIMKRRTRRPKRQYEVVIRRFDQKGIAHRNGHVLAALFVEIAADLRMKFTEDERQYIADTYRPMAGKFGKTLRRDFYFGYPIGNLLITAKRYFA